MGERLEILTTPPYFGFLKKALEGFGMRIDQTFKLESIAANRGADTEEEKRQRNAFLASEGLARKAERRGVDAVTKRWCEEKAGSNAVNRGADTEDEQRQRNAFLACEGLARNAGRRGVDAAAKR
jgi:hypothetical protein